MFKTKTEAREISSRWFWKEICVSTGVRKSGNTCASPIASGSSSTGSPGFFRAPT